MFETINAGVIYDSGDYGRIFNFFCQIIVPKQFTCISVLAEQHLKMISWLEEAQAHLKLEKLQRCPQNLKLNQNKKFSHYLFILKPNGTLYEVMESINIAGALKQCGNILINKWSRMHLFQNVK